ncbi:hypothetical protein PMI35_04051, partial [Pseudomonas sp. GM78]
MKGLFAEAALQPTWVLFSEYISIPAVTATYGFALTATHFFYKRQKKVSKKTLAPASGPSLGLGVPSLRHSSGGIALRLASLAPTCDVFDCVERRCAPIPG